MSTKPSIIASFEIISRLNSSVVAGACYGAKLCYKNGGIKSSIIKNSEYSRIYDFEASAVTESTTRKQVELDWSSEMGRDVSAFAQLVNPEPIVGRVVFQPSVMGINYRWGVYVYVVMDLEGVDTDNLTDIQKLIVDDWQNGTNTKVLMVPENGEWKVNAENPLF